MLLIVNIDYWDAYEKNYKTNFDNSFINNLCFVQKEFNTGGTGTEL